MTIITIRIRITIKLLIIIMIIIMIIIAIIIFDINDRLGSLYKRYFILFI